MGEPLDVSAVPCVQPVEDASASAGSKGTLDENCTMPYTVRNTFIDIAPAPGLEPSESIFSTWPATRQDDRDHETRQMPENVAAIGLDHESCISAGCTQNLRRGLMLSRPVTRHQRLPSLEDGEVSESDEDGEEFEEGELPDEEDCVENLGNARAANSLGSAGHAKGVCKPCARMHKSAAGCRNGERCEYCHLCPAGELKRRKRDKMIKRLVASAKQKSSGRTSAQLADPGGAAAKVRGQVVIDAGSSSIKPLLA